MNRRFLNQAGALVALTFVITARLAAGQPLAVEDGRFGSDPADLIVVGDYLYFSADDGVSGRELWRLDKSDAVEQLQEITAGPGGLDPLRLERAGEALYFEGTVEYSLSGEDSPAKRGLFTVRGAGPFVHQPTTGEYLWRPEHAAAFGNGMAFFGKTPPSGLEVWYLDAEQDDARLLHEFVPGPPDGTLGNLLIPHSGGILVTGFSPEMGKKSVLWFVGAPDTPPIALRDASGALIEETGPIAYSTGHSDIAYIAVQSDASYICRVSGPDTRVERIHLGPDVGMPVAQFAVNEEALYFHAHSATFGIEPYVLRHNELAPRLLMDIAPGPASSNPFRFFDIGSCVLFIADSPQYGAEIWRTEGTEESTRLVRDMLPGPRSAELYSFCRWGDGMLFSCDNDEFGEELWYTDGTAEGTRLVKDINPGLPQSEPYYLTPFNDAVYFAAITAVSGSEIWKTDGTPEGTVQVTSIWPPVRVVRSSDPESLTVLGDFVYFSATTPETGRELWRSDGTRDGTRCVADVHPGVTSSFPRDLRVADARLHFVADGPDGPASYTWNPKEDALNRVGDVPLDAVPQDRGPHTEVTVGDRVYFTHWTADLGEEPWVRDTITDKSTLLLDIVPGQPSSSPRDWTAIGDRIYFRAQDLNRGTEIWRTDGTPAGTQIVADLLPTPLGSIPRQLRPFRDGVVFLTRGLNDSRQILSIDRASTNSWLSTWQQEHLKVHELAGTRDRIFFTATHPVWGAELWCSHPKDTSVYLVRDIYPNTTR